VSELVLRALTKSFGDTDVLQGVDLVVPQGAFAAVLGPSGCGKTTLLRIVAGFETADAGTVALDGRVVSGPRGSVPPEHRRIGIVPQEGALFPHLTVAGNVGFGLTRAARRSQRAEQMLELVGLGGFGPRLPGELSGGQQQRVAVARALAPDPALVLLDEPFSALDTGLRAALREDVRAAIRAAGATAVLVTHDQQEALSMADLVAVLRDGRVVQAAPPEELYGAPRDLGVATFVGEAVVLPATLRGGLAQTALGPLRVRPHPCVRSGAGRVVVRPEQVLIGAPGLGVPARVGSTVFYGHDALVHVSLAGGVAVGTPGAGGANGSAGVGVIEVFARTQGPAHVAQGTQVGLTVLGEVSFYPDPGQGDRSSDVEESRSGGTLGT
jgi:iron(III) transport system ATP-binding protein